MLGFNQVSFPMMMSGFADWRRLRNSAFLLPILWKLITSVLSVWSCFTGLGFGGGFDAFGGDAEESMEQKLGGDTLCAGVEKLGGVQVTLKEFLVSGIPVVLLSGE